MSLRKITPPLSGIWAALAVLLLTLVFASCSKDSILSDDTEVDIIAQQGDKHTVSYYAITDSTGIGFTSQGIEYSYLNDGSHKWLLSYAEIADRLQLILQDYNAIHITRDSILKNGLWRFAVSFDVADQDDAYYIDVDPETGYIEWAVSITDMPGDAFTLMLVLRASK